MGSGNNSQKVQGRKKKMNSYKVLFIPGNVYHVRMFSKVAKKLKGDVLAISLEGYGEIGRRGIEKELENVGIKYKKIEEYERKEPRYIIEKEKPNVVIVLNDIDPACNMFVREAGIKGIPTILIAEREGFGGEIKFFDLNYVFLILKNFLKELQHSTKKTYIISQFVRQMVCKILGLSNYDKYGSYCSKIVAWGDYGKELFIKSGINPKNIIVAGNPLFDDFIKIRFNKRKARKKIGVSQKVKLLLYASCNPLDINYWNKSEAEMHIRSINKITSKIKNCLLIIRPHPTEEESRYLEYLKGEDLTNTKVSKKEDFYTVLSACDILITEASLAGLEAAIFGKPVIIVNFIGKQYPTQRYPFILIKEQVALEARTEEDFFEKVKVLLKTNTALSKKIKHNRRKFIKRYVYRLDGRASERIAKIIEKTAKKTT